MREGDALTRRLLVSGLSAALIAFPAFAHDDVVLSGLGELRSTYVYIDDVKNDDVIQAGESNDFWTLGAGGSLDAAWRAFHAQADFAGHGTVGEQSADDTEEGVHGGGLHLNLRDSDLGSIGTFGAVGKIKINDVGKNDPESVVWGIGGEAQVYIHWLTLYLQGGFLDRASLSNGGEPDALQNAGFGRGIVRGFWGDNVKLAAEASYAKGRMDPDRDDVRITGWGAEAEYRVARTPVSGFVRYTGANYHQNDDKDTLEVHRIGFGVRVYFGQPSLAANDRHGATLDLPRYLEWNGITAGTLE